MNNLRPHIQALARRTSAFTGAETREYVRNLYRFLHDAFSRVLRVKNMQEREEEEIVSFVYSIAFGGWGEAESTSYVGH